MSPSSRRAWIEISVISKLLHVFVVALLAEGVDRNPIDNKGNNLIFASPSSRRAWIEMIKLFR